MRKLTIIIVVSLLIISMTTPSTTPLLTSIKYQTAQDSSCAIPSQESQDSNLTWSARTQQSPQNIENNSVAAGDHVVVNGSFSPSLNVTECELNIWNGFTFTSTRSVIPASDPDASFEGSIIYDDFDWIVIKGIERGLTVNVTCNFTNANCDFMAWIGSMNSSLYSYSKSIVDMVSDDRPEHDSFVWESVNDTMILGCLNTANSTTGTWTATIQVGVNSTVSCPGSMVTMDTYYLESRNQTYNIKATGTTDIDGFVVLTRYNVSICNFFAPIVVVNPLVAINEEFTNISWTCTDLNQDDVNYFELWISRDYGPTFILLFENFTATTVIWDSSGWLEADYLVRIKAYSVDVTSEKCRLDDPPDSYWPGDFSYGYSPVFAHDGVPPVYSLHVNQVDDVVYEYGSLGNSINLTLYSSIYPAFSIDYIVRNNRSTWIEGSVNIESLEQTLVINIDNLSIGNHQIEVEFLGTTPVIISFTIEVVESPPVPFDSLPIILGIIAGCTLGGLFVIYMKSKQSRM